MANTRIRTPISTPDLACTNTYILVRFLLALTGSFPLHTQQSSYLLEIWLMMIDTHTHIRTLNFLYKHNSFLMLTGALPLCACIIALKLRTYFTSAG